jgi:hypothetical protein
MTRWPNLFIAGAPRSGTSSLHSYLQDIPGIYMSRIKEPNFFSRNAIADDHPMVKPIRDEAQYLQLFADAGDARILGEASPTYLEDPEAPGLIDRTVPGAKVIASLRDPVERLYSHYLMMLNNRPGMGSFLDEVKKGLVLQHDRSLAVLGPDVGLYYQQVRRFHEVFGDARFKVLIFEETMSDVPAALRGVLEFLGIEHDLANFDAPAQRQYSEARGPLVRYLFGNRLVSRSVEAFVPYRLRKLVRNTILVKQASKPDMDAESRAFLVDYYAEDVSRLADHLGRPLPWRNFLAATGSS